MNLMDELKLMIYESNLSEEEMNLCLEAVEECETEEEFFETADDVLCLMETRTKSDDEYATFGKDINSDDINEHRKKNPLYGTQYERMSDAEKRKRDLKRGSKNDSDNSQSSYKMASRDHPYSFSIVKLKNGTYVMPGHLKTGEDEAQIKKYEQQRKNVRKYIDDLSSSADDLIKAKNNKEINDIIRSRKAAGKKTYDVRDLDTYEKKLSRAYNKEHELYDKKTYQPHTKTHARLNLIRRVQSGEATPRTKKYIHDTFGGKYD